MDITTIYWALFVALVIAACVMAAGLLVLIISIYESVRRITTGRKIRSYAHKPSN